MITLEKILLWDLSCLICNLVKSECETNNIYEDKTEYFTRCLIKYTEIKGYEYLIVKTHLTITLIINEFKFTFWVVEIPEIQSWRLFKKYVFKELKYNFYKI